MAVILLASLAMAGRVGGEPNRPEWRWRTVETEHFAVHYPEPRRPGHPVGASETARAVARAAERAWPELALATGVWPRARIHVVLRDDGDALLGRAVPAWDLVTLSVNPGRDLARARGRTDLAELVAVHEIAHVISHGPVSSMSRAATVGPEIGGVGWVSGNVGVGGALRFPGGPPSGWSEGRAEWLAEQAGVAWWSAERAMVLRTAALSGELPTWAAWTLAPESDLWGIGEQRYQAGFAFARVHAAALGEAGAAAGRGWRPTWDRAWRRATGASGAAAWSAFERELTVAAQAWIASRDPVDGHLTAAAPKEDRDATVVLSPRLSPDGSWQAEASGAWTGAFSPSGGPAVWVPGGGGYAFVPSADALVVSAARRPGRVPPEDGFSRLVRVELRCGRATRCTRFVPGTERATDPAISPDGTQLAWLRFRDGVHEVVVAAVDGSDPRVLAGPRAPLSGLSFAPEGDRLVTSAWRDGQANLWAIAVDGSEPVLLGETPPNEDDPWWAPDGSIVFVADVDGVTDVFRRTDTGITRLTRVTGGAATPSLDPDGALRFSAFDEFGWRARRLPANEWVDEPTAAFASAWTLTAPASPPRAIEDVPYRAIRALRPASLIPVLRLEPASAPELGPVVPRGGAWLQAVDAVENVSLDGLFLLGADLLAAGSVTWRGWRPSLSLDLSRAARAPGLAPERLDRASVRMELPIYAGLSVDARALGYLLGDGAAEVLASGGWTTLGLTLDDRRFEGGLWGTAARTATPWLRGELAGTAIGRLGHDDHRLTLGGCAAWTDRRVEDENRLFLGGDHPAAWLTARLQGSTSFPALPAYADTGDALAVGRAGWQVPFATDRAARLGPLIGTDLLGFLGVDVGDAWDLGRPPAARIAGIADVRWRAELAGSAWDGVVRAAWTPRSEARFFLSFGSGW